MKDLQQLIDAWDSWALIADKSENGWESDFPEWRELMDAAWRTACDSRGLDSFPLLEKCLTISSENEDLIQKPQDAWGVVDALSRSPLAECRWQIYDAAGAAAATAETLLRRGLGDVDAYARRRAIMCLARLRPRDARELAASLVSDPDAYIRHAAISLILVAGNDEFIVSALGKLLKDPVDHVREAAAQALQRRTP
jgi:HEAT repeat protein